MPSPRLERTVTPRDWLPNNSERAERQQETPIQVIVGNPPWSTGQRSSADDNPNVDYPEIEARISATYAARSTATLKNSLYDMYKMAIRWASDRIAEQGVIALVTNGSWIDGNVDSGVRACLAEEFTSIYVLNLRGNQRTQGERSRREGGKIFGQGSRAPVAITFLVRNPKAAGWRCRILYRDIGDYLTREEKLNILHEAGSIAGVTEWHEISPDRHHDWIDQRNESFQNLLAVGSKEAKAGKTDDALFKLFSNGYKSGRDGYVYNYSQSACTANARVMVDTYLGALQARTEQPKRDLSELVGDFSTCLRWDRELKRRLQQQTSTEFSRSDFREVSYRPFVKQHLYANYTFAQAPGATREIFPEGTSENRLICVPSIGSTRPFSTLMVNTLPDIQLMFNGQCFPRYRYQRLTNAQPVLPGLDGGPKRADNITDWALQAVQGRYSDNTITKDQIFDYVYGILHAPDYRERFATDLAKGLPRCQRRSEDAREWPG